MVHDIWYPGGIHMDKLGRRQRVCVPYVARQAGVKQRDGMVQNPKRN